MATLLKFPVQTKKESKGVNEIMSKIPRNYGIFDELSKRVGADMDKIVFEKNEDEIRKMNRNLHKETLKVRSENL